MLRRLVLPAFLVLLSGATASASVLFQEAFDNPAYTIGSDVDPTSSAGVSGWVNAGPTSPYTIVPGLAFGNLQFSGFAAASPAYTGSVCCNSTAVHSFTNSATTDLWFSMLVALTTGNADSNTDAYAGVALQSSSAQSQYLFFGIPGGTAKFDLQSNLNSNAIASPDSGVLPLYGSPTLLILHVASDNTASLWVNTVSFPGDDNLGTANAVITSPIAAGAFDSISLTTSWGWTFDQMIIGTTLADVTPTPVAPTPEPSTYLLVVTGLLVMGQSARRFRSSI